MRAASIPSVPLLQKNARAYPVAAHSAWASAIAGALANRFEQCPSCQRIVFWEGIVAKTEGEKKSGSVEARA